MPATNETVRGRIDRARIDLTPGQLLAIVGVVAALGFALLFLQEPLLHDSLHNFRHSIGITCH